MLYGENFEQALKLAESALSTMRDKGVSPNPNNFTIWFHYHSGKYPDLTRALDDLLEAGAGVSDAQCVEIFHRFFTFEEEGAVVSDTADKVESQLALIVEYLETAESGAAEYGSALEAFSGQVRDADQDVDIKGLVGTILSETRAMAEQSRGLEEKLSASSQEIQQLKGALEEMRHEAMTDALTGIPNRKHFDVELRRAAMAAKEKEEELCLLMIDIDYFKRFNDNHGHVVGDNVLKLLGATLKENIKGRDTAARYGGEEFAVILPDTRLSDAVQLADKIRQHVAEKRVINRRTGEELGRITISIGVGRLVQDEPLGQLIARTDEALYTAKREGRNKVVSEEEVEDPRLSFHA